MKKALLGFAAVLLVGCSTAPKSEMERKFLREDADASLAHMKERDPGLDDMLVTAYGYAVFPGVGKGGLLVGGTYGRGTVYEQGKFIGYADITQATVGGQIGGATFDELIVLQDSSAMNRFKSSKLSFEATTSAVALDNGTSHAAAYKNGVVVFAKMEGGLMADAVIGGQQFTYLPAEGELATPPGETVNNPATTMPASMTMPATMAMPMTQPTTMP